MPSRKPILYNGELYSYPIDKGQGGPQKEPNISYDIAREKVLKDINSTVEKLSSLPSKDKLPHEFVVSIKMSSEFTAKSYYPYSLFDQNNYQMSFNDIGSRYWRKKHLIEEKKEVEEVGKMIFVRATENGIKQFQEKLNHAEARLTKKFILDVRKIDSIDVLQPAEKILGIPDGWKEGRLEAVLHPFHIDRRILIDHFISTIEPYVDIERINHKQYESGITFISFIGNNEAVEVLRDYNPLRTIHPFQARVFENTRGSYAFTLPQQPTTHEKSPVIVGVFDGGVDINNPYLKDYVEDISLVPEKANRECVEHGTAVTGMALYGPLNNYSKTDTLPVPEVFIKSFRVLPRTNPLDLDLSEVIDKIEAVVPNEKNIKVYNLSLGPEGPILDDHISRFTYALDRLSVLHNVLFCVAVGNDGNKTDPLNRIQSPSDLVNGLAIGAYTKIDGLLQRAFYSCVGPGREGNKMKPDICSFGGCDRNPVHLIGLKPGQKLLWYGTSFSSPYVTSIAAQLIGRSNNIVTPLVARALLIHTGKHEDNTIHNLEIGHGAMPENIDEIITKDGNSYTLIYKGELAPSKFAQLDIPWVEGQSVDGSVFFDWTMVSMSKTDDSRPDDYTESSFLLSFYPNIHKFLFTNKSTGKTQRIDIQDNPELEKKLLDEGWDKSTFPLTDSGNAPFASEEELRNQMKWDTVISRSKTKRNGNSIKKPFFHIHALTRGKSTPVQDTIKFALVLTVQAFGKNAPDIYSNVLQHYQALAPLKLLNRNEIRVQT